MPSASANTRNSKTGSAKSSTASSSASNSAMSSSISGAPRRCCGATSCCRARASGKASGCAPIFTMCGRKRAARRSSCRAPIRNTWPSYSPRRCRKSTTASSRSRQSRATPAAAPRSRSSRATAASTRSAPASACAAAAFRRWSADPATFVVNALAPAEVTKVVMDEEQRRIEVVVPDDQLSLAIGRRGQNVRLASQLTGWDIDILTEAEESERRTEEFRTRSQMFIDALDIDDVIAHLLVTEGFGSLEEVAFVAVEDLAEIEGFDVDVAAELQERARTALERRDREYESRFRELGVEDDLAAVEGLTPGMLVTLGENEIKTLDDFAGLAGDELVEMLAASDKGGVKLELDDANALIMAARAHWYEPADTDAAEKE